MEYSKTLQAPKSGQLPIDLLFMLQISWYITFWFHQINFCFIRYYEFVWYFIINYVFVDRSIASSKRIGDFKVTGSHDISAPISVDLSLLVTAAEKLHLSNTILYEIQRDSTTGNANHCLIIGLVFNCLS